VLAGCGGGGGGMSEGSASSQSESCMVCHNGATNNDYSGPGIENPHPFPLAPMLTCTTCHGGNPRGTDKASSHVPAPPQIGDRSTWTDNGLNWFNRLTLAGIDKFPNYTVNGVTYTGIDYLQFVQPGDLRVVTQSRACGACHGNHAQSVARSVLATETGFFGGSMYFIGVDNAITAQQGLYDNTASDYAFRTVTDPSYVYDPQNRVGAVQNLIEVPVMSSFGKNGGMNIFRNAAYDALNLSGQQTSDGKTVTGSKLQNLFMEQVAFTCGDCHLGHRGANNRYGDYRSSGCTACHMRYSQSGRSGSKDPNVSKTEPIDVDDIDAPELPHVAAHRINSIAKTMSNGAVQKGIDDYACIDCHQGSNRNVLQFWGVRLDQNQDLRNRFQYPANPVTWTNTAADTRLFDPAIRNRTINGRNANQYILKEDYDGDGRDDTPADVHYDAGMGCIDCHGSFDIHGGNTKGPQPDTMISSHMEQQVAVACENCHGTITAYAATQQGTASDGTIQQLAVDSKGNTINHVRLEADGNYYLYSRLTGAKHFVPQTKDVVVNNGKMNPFTMQPIYDAKGSYAMGRDDGDPSNGIGPTQQNTPPSGFSHTDNMQCAACHASWSNTCVGCHLKLQYDEGGNYSNITGERIVVKQRNADFVYQTPVPFQLGVDTHNKISQVATNTKVYFQWRDRNNIFSQIFTWTDRNGDGNNPQKGIGSLGHNALLAHSIRGRVSSTKEGPKYCVACHLTTTGLANYGTEYDAFRTAMQARNYGALDYNLLQTHIGKNPGNQLNSPLWVHMVAGLGSGLFLFDKNGAAVNPLDTNANRIGSGGLAPAFNFDPADVTVDLDRIVDETGFSYASNNHSMLNPGVGPNLRDGAADPTRPGPLGATLIKKLSDPVNGMVLDSWIDADGNLQGNAPNYVQ
jgi:hypothetical protein